MGKASNSVSAASKHFAEAIVISDDQDWIWNFARQALHRSGLSPLRLPSSVSLRDSRARLDNGRPIVIDWACRARPASALIEELREYYGNGAMTDRIIVLATDVIREDALYFGELGIARLLVLRNRDVELARATRDFLAHWQSAATGLAQAGSAGARSDAQWRSLLRHIDTAMEHYWEKKEGRVEEPQGAPGSVDFAIASSVSAERALGAKAWAALIDRARGFLGRALDTRNAAGNDGSARDLDLEASLLVLLDRPAEALQRWLRACELNPNFHRAHVNFSRCLRQMGRHEEALAIVRLRLDQNRKSIGLLVEMGDIHLSANEIDKASHHYQMALDRDAASEAALNGMAQVKFARGELHECRQLLARSGSSSRAAARFNAMGIDLVRAGKFAEALELYARAQFVLPQQEKGPMLFYNMGLCYLRWGRGDVARDFVKLALIKDPAYAKAKSLLARMESGEVA